MVALGGILGFERELAEQPAGLPGTLVLAVMRRLERRLNLKPPEKER